MADRGPVKILEPRIQALIDLYSSVYKKITTEMITATVAGKIQRARLMVRINHELEVMGVDVQDWIKKEIPRYYNDGAAIAIQDLRKLGLELSTATSAPINAAAIAALVDETSAAAFEAITGISRNVSNIISSTQRRALTLTIAEGKLTAETRKMLAAQLKEQLAESGIGAIKDKLGREWTFDRYSSMLVRTQGVEARNMGLANKMVQYGYDLVQVSNHGTKHLACRKWEGKILSITGKTPGYPTLAQAKAEGLFHPNCKHAINVINESLAKKTKAYDNPYLKLSPEEQRQADIDFRNRNKKSPPQT